jgi:hypothetical protein
MAYTNIGSKAGIVYDADEILRYNDLVNKLNYEAEKADDEVTKKKDIIRYFIVGAGAILILVSIKLLVKNRK